MEQVCYGCFNGTLNEQGVCTVCGYDSAKDREKYPLALPAGSILYGRYIIGKVLGQGGFGITYLAQDYQTKKLVAIKEFFPDTMVTRTQTITVTPFTGERGENFAYGKTSFLDEAQTMAEFNGNPNIAGVQIYFEENGTGYYVMEYIDGTSFESYIKSHGGRISWDETMKIMLPVLKALDAVHAKGIIHRDVTPDNIYITKDGTVKLLDFGAARHSLGNVSRSLDVILKHGFAPKEQYSRRGRQGPYTDVYAASATIYYAITGTKPDDAIERSTEDNMPLPSNIGARITPQQEDVLLKGLAVNAPERYQTMGEFCAALTAAKGGAADIGKTATGPEKETDKTVADFKTETEQRAEQKEEEKTVILSVGSPKKKKIGLIAAICAGVLLCGFLIFWFGHPHKYGDEWTTVKAATCTEKGLQERSCFCGELDTRTVPALGHQESTDAAVAATCTEWGLTEGAHCSACGEVLKAQKKNLPLGHDIVTAAAVAPTCTSTGLTEGKSCQRCGLVTIEQTVIEALGHKTVTDAAVAATCTTEGKTEGSHCSVCKTVLKAQTKVAATGHKWSGNSCSHCGTALWTVHAYFTKSAYGNRERTEVEFTIYCADSSLSTVPYITYGIEGANPGTYTLSNRFYNGESSSVYWANGFGAKGKLVVSFYTGEGYYLGTVTAQIY